MRATDFIILRNVTSDSRITLDVPTKPIKVATLIDEEKFVASDHRLIHLDTVFFEDFFARLVLEGRQVPLWQSRGQRC